MIQFGMVPCQALKGTSLGKAVRTLVLPGDVRKEKEEALLKWQKMVLLSKHFGKRRKEARKGVNMPERRKYLECVRYKRL